MMFTVYCVMGLILERIPIKNENRPFLMHTSGAESIHISDVKIEFDK